MPTWTKRGESLGGAWSNRPYWGKRRYWRRTMEAEYMAARAVEQAEIRRTFIIDASIKTRP